MTNFVRSDERWGSFSEDVQNCRSHCMSAKSRVVGGTGESDSPLDLLIKAANAVTQQRMVCLRSRLGM